MWVLGTKHRPVRIKQALLTVEPSLSPLHAITIQSLSHFQETFSLPWSFCFVFIGLVWTGSHASQVGFKLDFCQLSYILASLSF